MGASFTVNGAMLRADPTGALFWPEQSLLIVADLHLEKGSHFARKGQLLPPYDTRDTIDRLARVLQRFAPRRVVCLGDSFHDGDAASRLAPAEVERLRRLTAAYDWIWLAGNHDPAPPEGLGGRVVAELAEGPLVLRHQPGESNPPSSRLGEICGHFHPKATVPTRGRAITGRCFVTDGTRLILPAFGAYTGGLDVLAPAISGLFGRANFRVLLINGERVHLFSRASLVRPAPAPLAKVPLTQ
jgi:DNA ligase-associated metallophosphoesterase